MLILATGSTKFNCLYNVATGLLLFPSIKLIITYRAKDVLPNINHTQAAVSVHCRHPITPGGDGTVSSAAAWRRLQRTAHALQCIVNGDDSAVFRFFCHRWPWSLTFDLDIQTRPSEGPSTYFLWIWRISVQPFPRHLSNKQKLITDSETELFTCSDSASTRPHQHYCRTGSPIPWILFEQRITVWSYL